MNFLGNLLWLIFGGLLSSIAWFLAGCLWCVTLIGIPIGIQCFKFASLMLSPFGKDIMYGGGTLSLIANVFWLLLSGLPLAIMHLLCGIALCITIIGIPFGLQQFKFTKLALMPFGASIY